jgi:amidase
MRLAVATLLLLCATASADVTGRWLISFDRMGVPQWYSLELAQKGTQVSGKFDTDPLTGTLIDGNLKFLGKDPNNNGTDTIEATVDGDSIKGQMTLVFGDDTAHPLKAAFTAERIAAHVGKPQRRAFTPTQFFREFSPKNPPVMHVGIGDTIVTTTVDAGGNDAKGDQRSAGGNPQTGPFYVDGAMPGDTLVVKINKLRLNRDYAISDDGIVDRAVDPGLAAKAAALGKDVRWKLDRVKNLATSELPGQHLTTYTVPTRPMLGCIATAVAPGNGAPPTQDSGYYGGNLDFNELVEGATVYLPVSNPGALLYVGDGHAAQGDGELNGNALETSLDVEVTVDVIPGKRSALRVESATHIIAMGYAGSLDDSMKAATSNMAEWLKDLYGLTPSEIAQVIGTSAEYRVAEVADRNAGMALMLRKDRLRTIKK